jgi:hypothetical protein
MLGARLRRCAGLLVALMFALAACDTGTDITVAADADPRVDVVTAVVNHVSSEDTVVVFDSRLLPLLPGGMLPPGTDAHFGVPLSPIMQSLAAADARVEILDAVDWDRSGTLAVLSEPTVRGDEATVEVAFSQRIGESDTATSYELYTLSRDGGAWSVRSVKWVASDN